MWLSLKRKFPQICMVEEMYFSDLNHIMFSMKKCKYGKLYPLINILMRINQQE